MSEVFNPLVGGILIGVSSSLMLFLLGRITGISGIFSNILEGKTQEGFWRHFFILGLIFGGLLMRVINPSLMDFTINASVLKIILAGVFVGYGTRLGSGCTSGHGVCGLARLSKRSFFATCTFIGTGMVTVAVMRLL